MPAGAPEGPPQNVGHLYLRMARAIRDGTAVELRAPADPDVAEYGIYRSEAGGASFERTVRSPHSLVRYSMSACISRSDAVSAMVRMMKPPANPSSNRCCRR